MGIAKEFKEFIAKGDVISMAVGIIIGGAFQAIVAALTSSFINPLIALVTGGTEVDENGNEISETTIVEVPSDGENPDETDDSKRHDRLRSHCKI